MWNGLQEQYGDQFDSELARILQLEMEEQMSDDYEQNGEQEFQQEDPNAHVLQNVTEELGQFRQFMEEYQQNQLRAEEEKQLDGVLNAMHQHYGDFDDDWILQRISVHGNVAQAFQEWNAMLGKFGGQGTPRQAPKVMGGQGGVPSNNVDPSKVRGKDRKQLVANLLEAAQEQ